MAIISIPTSVAGVSIPGQLGKLATGPLSALFGSPGLKTVSYPQDLATDATKSHYVQFSIKEIIPANVQTRPKYLVNNKTMALNHAATNLYIKVTPIQKIAA
jgi:hypothetical protein